MPHHIVEVRKGYNFTTSYKGGRNKGHRRKACYFQKEIRGVLVQEDQLKKRKIKGQNFLFSKVKEKTIPTCVQEKGY